MNLQKHIIAYSFLMTAMAFLLSGCGQGANRSAPRNVPVDTGSVSGVSVDPAGAEAFIARVEKYYRESGEYAARTAFVNQTYINFDTNWLNAKAEAEYTEQGVRFATEAALFDQLPLSPDFRRKMNIIKLGPNIPVPLRPGASENLSRITTRMSSAYATGEIEFDGRQVPRVELEVMAGTLRDPEKLKEIWIKWREIPVSTLPSGDGSMTTMKKDYAAMVALANEGARDLGFSDLGHMWRSRYEMPSDAFILETDRLWGQIKPFYEQLHCHVRARLNKQYGDGIVPLRGPLRADLLGNMWAQSWGGIRDLVMPEDTEPGYDLTELLQSGGYDAVDMVRAGENFFSSLGFEPLPDTFWTRSQIVRPEDRNVSCHASAWNLDGEDDIRIKMCTMVNGDDFRTIHHELGHNYYQRAYKNLSPVYRDGANAGFHEAVGDMVALSVTPQYLHETGLLETLPGPSSDASFLMDQALEKIAFLPFGLLMDKWRWQVFSGELVPETYNEGWWKLREFYQGVRPPVVRGSHYFDPGGKYHIPNNVSYTRYFIAHILQFQFHRAACKMAGYKGPLHRCSIYGASDTVGRAFRIMLEAGRSRPWPEILEEFTGSPQMDASALVEYFSPLISWLEKENAGRQCGW